MLSHSCGDVVRGIVCLGEVGDVRKLDIRLRGKRELTVSAGELVCSDVRTSRRGDYKADEVFTIPALGR